jgi:mono/diheme cytochrome c family protein
MTMRQFAGLAVAGLIAAAALTPIHAQPLNKLERQGQELLTRLCSRCHAVGRTGTSPRKQAPPLRTIAQRYDVADLVAQLQEGFTGPHPDMPTFTFTRNASRAVEAYLNAIQK